MAPTNPRTQPIMNSGYRSEKAEAEVTSKAEGERANNLLRKNNFNKGSMGVRLGESTLAPKTVEMHRAARQPPDKRLRFQFD